MRGIVFFENLRSFNVEEIEVCRKDILKYTCNYFNSLYFVQLSEGKLVAVVSRFLGWRFLLQCMIYCLASEFTSLIAMHACT